MMSTDEEFDERIPPISRTLFHVDEQGEPGYLHNGDNDDDDYNEIAEQLYKRQTVEDMVERMYVQAKHKLIYKLAHLCSGRQLNVRAEGQDQPHSNPQENEISGIDSPNARPLLIPYLQTMSPIVLEPPTMSFHHASGSKQSSRKRLPTQDTLYESDGEEYVWNHLFNSASTLI